MHITPGALASVFIGFNTLFQSALKATEPVTDRLSMSVPSVTEKNVYAWMAKLPRVREWVGPRHFHNMAAYTQELVNRSFELSLEVDRDRIKDDQLGIFNDKLAMMGAQMGRLMDDLRVDALMNGHTAAATTFDGVPFFSAAHPVNPNDADAGVQSNLFNLALDRNNYQTVRSAMLSLKGEDGRRLRVSPRLLVVPQSLEIAAKDIVVAERLANGADNTLKGTAELLVVPELDDEPTAWYLMDVTNPIKPLVSQWREAPTFVSQTAPDSDGVFLDKVFRYGSEARCAAGYGLWFLAARSKP